MNNKVRYNIKTIILLTTFFILMCSVCLLFGCSFPFFRLQNNLADKNYTINRIVYTNNIDSYVTNENVVYYGTTLGFYTEIPTAQIYYIVKNNNEFDLIIDNTNDLTWQTQYTASLLIRGLPVDSVGFWNYALDILIGFDCTHIFSGTLPNVYSYNMYGVCENVNCICGAGWGGSDGNEMSCKSSSRGNCELYNKFNGKTKESATQLTDEELYVIDGEEVCKECWRWNESGDEENGYVYTIENCCNCTAHIEAEDPYINVSNYIPFLEARSNYNSQYITSPVASNFILDFKELVIDGFDFSTYINLINNLDKTRFHNYEELIHTDDFSYMFSDLPVEKITIKNVSGLENARNFSHLFENCTNLKTIDFGNMFSEAKPEDLSYMFFNCPNLENLDLSSIDTTKVTNMSNMFSTFSSYDEKIEIYFNKVLIPYLYTLNSGSILSTKYYTIDEFIELMEQEGEIETIPTKQQIISATIKIAKMMFGWDIDYTPTLLPGSKLTEEYWQEYLINTYFTSTIPELADKWCTVDEALAYYNSHLENDYGTIRKELFLALINEETNFQIPLTKEETILTLLNTNLYKLGLSNEFLTFEKAITLINTSTDQKAQGIKEILGNDITVEKLKEFVIYSSQDYADILQLNKKEIFTIIYNSENFSTSNKFVSYDEIIESTQEQNLSDKEIKTMVNYYCYNYNTELCLLTIEEMADILAYSKNIEIDTESLSIPEEKIPLYILSKLSDDELHCNTNRDSLVTNILKYISRDDYIEVLINQKSGSDVWFDIDSTLEYLNSQSPEKEITKTSLVAMLNSENNYDFPISYNEYLCIITSGEIQSIEEAIQYAKNNPELAESEYGIPQKDGEYTEQELRFWIDINVKHSYSSTKTYTVVDENMFRTQKDVEIYNNSAKLWDDRYLISDAIAKAKTSQPGKGPFTLTFGSNFVVNENTNVENMFGTVYNFGKIITPRIVGDLSIKLPTTYTCGEQITKDDSNLLIEFVDPSSIEPTPPPQEDDDPNNPDNPNVPNNPNNNSNNNDNTNLVIIISCSIAFLILVLIIISIVYYTINKKHKNRYKNR